MSQETDLKPHLEAYNALRSPKDRGIVCHAPFVSMNFEQSGKVTACCYNRNHVIGRYPEQTVAEMWNSPKIDELRNALARDDFSVGCGACAEHLKAKNYYSNLMKHFDRLQVNGWEAARTGPRILEFELSNLCNLQCVMCNGSFSSSIRKHREKLPPLKFPWDEAFVEQLRPFWKTVEWAKFLGGEPFLNPLYFKIWRQIAEENPKVKVVITTNGTIRNRKVDWVLEHVKPFLVLSIDSFQKQTYESIRVGARCEDTLQNLAYFVHYAREHERTVDIAVCPMVNNWQDMPEIFEWGIRNVVQVNFNTVTYPEHLSLANAPVELLREVIDRYRSTRMPEAEEVFQDPSPWTRTVAEANRNRFRSLADQIEYWSIAALKRSSGSTESNP